MAEIKIRQLQEKDLANGFLESLDSLRKTSNIDKKRARSILKKMKGTKNYFVYIAELDSEIIGAATVFIEQKFIHNGGLVGHIEDVAVRKQFQGKGVGQKLVKALLLQAKKSGCYKTILDCNDDLIPFYQKIGFKHYSNSMRVDHK